MSNTPYDVDVLVIGAGPTGLSAANEAVRHGLTVKIFDRKPHRSAVSKALVIHARTLEAFETMGMVSDILAAGVPFETLRVIPGQGAVPIEVNLMNLDWGDTRYGYWLSLPQFETERVLEEKLGSKGLDVNWGASFKGMSQDADGVRAEIELADGTPQTFTGRWLIGCDGGRSPVRAAAGIGFDQEELGQTFVIADALGDAPIPESHGTTSMSDDGVLFFVPMPEPGRWRIIAHVPDVSADERVTIDAGYVDGLLKARLGFDFATRDLAWTSQFTLKQGMAARYRAGRVFIAGDAAHLHSPIGGQGLNTGVQDAFALLWRIALAERSAPDRETLLDSYSEERRTVAAAMVKSTTRATSVVTMHSGLVAKLRSFVAKQALRARPVQNRLGRTVGMLDVGYEGTSLALVERAAKLPLGSRLPNPTHACGCLHDLLSDRRHTLLLAPAAGLLDESVRTALTEECAAMGIKAVFLDQDQTEPLQGAQTVLVRPDRVVAAASEQLDASLVRRYAEEVIGVPTAEL